MEANYGVAKAIYTNKYICIQYIANYINLYYEMNTNDDLFSTISNFSINVFISKI